VIARRAPISRLFLVVVVVVVVFVPIIVIVLRRLYRLADAVFRVLGGTARQRRRRFPSLFLGISSGRARLPDDRRRADVPQRGQIVRSRTLGAAVVCVEVGSALAGRDYFVFAAEHGQ